MNTLQKRGFTLVELLIVIAIIGALMGLLLPAINAARERGRQASCMNNLKESATAMVSYATGGKGEFPGWAQAQRTTISYVRGLDADPSTNNVVDLAVTWSAKLLPRLDQAALWDQLLTNNENAGIPPLDSESIYNSPPRLEVFVCPSDVGTNPDAARLTYVANTGMWDLTNSGPDLKANGLCHDQRPGRNGPAVRYGADIKDGAATTLMLAENIHKDEMALGVNVANSWLNPVARFPMDPMDYNTNAEQVFGMVWVYDSNNPFDPAENQNNPAQARFNREPDTFSGSYADREQVFARPASAHPEIFNVAFAGGNARSINETIEYRVYQQLMTPNGAKAALPDDPTVTLNQLMGQDNFMNPPLSEGDY